MWGKFVGRIETLSTLSEICSCSLECSHKFAMSVKNCYFLSGLLFLTHDATALWLVWLRVVFFVGDLRFSGSIFR